MTNRAGGIRLESIRKLWHMLVTSDRRFLVVLLLMTFIGMVLETAGIGLVIPAIALVTQDDYQTRYPWLMTMLNNPSREYLVVFGMVTLVVVYIAKNLFLAFFLYLQSRFNSKIQIRLSTTLFKKYLYQPYSFHLEHNSSTLIRNIEMCGNIGNYGITPAMLLITETLVLTSLCVLLVVVEPIGAISVVAGLGISTFMYHRITRRKLSKWGESQLGHAAKRVQHLQQGLGGIKDVVLLGRENEFLKEFDIHNRKNAEISRNFSIVQSLPRLWMETLAVVGLALLVVVILAQNRAIDGIVPTLAVFAATAFRLMPSANRILWSVQNLRYGKSTIDTLSVEFERPDREITASIYEKSPLRSELMMTDVWYTYPSAHQPALSEITLAIQRGESVGFVGPSGAGKSTLVDVMLGLLPPTRGEMLLDGNSIQQNLRGWQEQIGYVPQSIYLTDDTLRRNVAFGLRDCDIDDKEVWRALTAAQLDEFVRSLPAGVETVVGERGIRLSGGQRQRIGIARALYHDPSVLVLDEATSSLDTETEHGVMQSVNALHGTKTVVIVAHRLSTVEYCDRLYRIEDSRVVNEGSYEAVTGFLRTQSS